MSFFHASYDGRAGGRFRDGLESCNQSVMSSSESHALTHRSSDGGPRPEPRVGVTLAFDVVPTAVGGLRRGGLARLGPTGRGVGRKSHWRCYDVSTSSRRRGRLVQVRVRPDGTTLPLALEHNRASPLFDLVETRTTRSVGEGEAAARVDLIVGEWRAGDRTAPIARLEIIGDGALAFALAERLVAAAPVRLTDLSLLDGGRIVAGETPPAPRPVEPEVAADAAAEGAFAAILSACREHLLASERAIRDGGAVEGVHQMRVALRRLRAALLTFKPLLPRVATAHLASEARWLGAVLSPVRDLDVFLADTLSALPPMIRQRDGMAALADRARRERVELADVMAQVLASERHQRFLLDLTGWIALARWRDQPLDETAARLFAPMREVAPMLLDRRLRPVGKFGRRLATLDEIHRHEFRKSVKKLRYATEFLWPVLGCKRDHPFLDALVGLQERLGVLNDAAIAGELAGRLAAATNIPAAWQAAGYLAGWLDRQAADAGTNLDAAWRRLANRRLPWR
jgi:CHAD domain-containing protein